MTFTLRTSHKKLYADGEVIKTCEGTIQGHASNLVHERVETWFPGSFISPLQRVPLGWGDERPGELG